MVNMNKYNYEIYKKNKFLIIKEKINDSQSFNSWEVNEFIPNNFNFSSETKIISSKEEYLNSYNRTKKWLKENHPELLI